MIKFIAVCSSKIRAQASIVPCDNHTASPRRLLLIVTVFHSEASLFADIFQEPAVFVFAYAANIDCRVCGEDILWNNSCQHSDLTQLSGHEIVAAIVPEHHGQYSVLLHRQ